MNTNQTEPPSGLPLASYSRSYFPGMDCQCAARSESECGCPGVDWTQSEVHDLRNMLKEARESLAFRRGLYRRKRKLIKYADPSGSQRMISPSLECVEEHLRIALDGHPESELWGEHGLIAATMRAVNATNSALAGRLVGFDCREKTLTFAMDEMPSTGALGESGLIYLPNVTGDLPPKEGGESTSDVIGG